MLMDMCLPKFDIYQVTVAPNCFNPLRVNFKLPTNCLSVFNHFVELALKASRATQTLDILIIFKKNVLPDVRFEIRLVRPNIIST